MAVQSFSLHIGLNKVDPAYYAGWKGELSGCENDAEFYYSLARNTGFTNSQKLLSTANDPDDIATSSNVIKLLNDYSKVLLPGDYLFITYSGHGGVVEDENNDEDDWQDETWCLYDRQFIDDELWQLFSRFKKDVRIFLVSDSCHSGSIAKGIDADDDEKKIQVETTNPKIVYREAPRNITAAAFTKYRDIYLPFAKGPIIDKSTVAATIIQFGACQDNERAGEENGYGVFTSAFKQALSDCKSYDCYSNIFEKVKEIISKTQNPNLMVFGPGADDFLKQKLFLFNVNKDLLSAEEKQN